MVVFPDPTVAFCSSRCWKRLDCQSQFWKTQVCVPLLLPPVPELTKTIMRTRTLESSQTRSHSNENRPTKVAMDEFLYRIVKWRWQFLRKWRKRRESGGVFATWLPRIAMYVCASIGPLMAATFLRKTFKKSNPNFSSNQNWGWN